MSLHESCYHALTRIFRLKIDLGAQAYQTVMSSDGPVQVNAPLLLKQPVKQQFVPRSQLVQSGQKVHTLPVGSAHSNGTKRNGSHLQLSAIQLKPNAQPVQAPVYRKITTQQFSRPGKCGGGYFSKLFPD